MCLTKKFYGLQMKKDGDGKFEGFIVHDIGSMIQNIDPDMYGQTGADNYDGGRYEFMFTGFHVVDDTNTMFLVFKEEKDGKDKYHYLFLNENSYDKVYGFSTIQSIVVDQLVANPEDVFSRVEAIKTLDSVNIALTDYGFWDLEKNDWRAFKFERFIGCIEC